MNIKDIMNHLGAHSPRHRKLVLSRLEDLSHFEHQEFVADFFGLKYPGHTQNFIDCYVYFIKCYEEGLLSKIKDILEIDSRKSFVDIGANIGHHSLFGSLYGQQVYAFEPYKRVRNKLLEKIALNQLSNIKVYPFGLGDQDQILPFFEPSDSNLGTGSFINNGSTSVLNLEIKQGNQFFEKEGIRNIGLLKIDVEGFETQVLRGLLPFIHKEKPFLIFEYGPITHEEMKKSPELKEYLLKNYKLEIFEDSNRLDYQLMDFHFHLFGDVLCTPLR